MDRMTAKEEAFCKNIMQGMKQYEAYTAAGYKASDYQQACVYSSALMRKDKIVKRLREMRDAEVEPFLLSAKQRKKILADIVTAEDSTKKERMQAMDILNKMEACYTNKTEITGANGGELKISWQK